MDDSKNIMCIKIRKRVNLKHDGININMPRTTLNVWRGKYDHMNDQGKVNKKRTHHIQDCGRLWRQSSYRGWNK